VVQFVINLFMYLEFHGYKISYLNFISIFM
jgi:hypothetical protein